MNKTVSDLETLYGQVLLEFERSQRQRGKRGPLPCDPFKSILTRNQREEKNSRAAHRRRVIMPFIKDGEIVDSISLEPRCKLPARTISAYLEFLFRDGLLDRRHIDPKRRNSARCRPTVWEYWKVGTLNDQ